MTDKDVFQEMSRSALIIFSGIVFGSVFNYISRVLIGRFYGPEDYGLISLGLAVLGFATAVSHLGLRQGTSRWTSRFIDDKNKIKGITISAFKISLPLSIAATFLLLIFPEELSLLLNEPQLPSIVRIFAIGVPLMIILDIFVAAIRGMQNSKYKVYSYDVIWPLIKVALVTTAVVLGLSIEFVAGFHVLTMAFAAASSFYFLRKILPWFKIKAGEFSSKKLVAFSWPLMISSILLLILGWIDTFMISYFQTSKEIGIYNAAYPTASVLIFVYSSFAYLLMPKASELYSNGRKDKLKNLYKTVVRWTTLLNLPILVFMLLFSGSIITLLFGQEFASGGAALFALVIAYFVTSLGNPSGQMLISIGETKIYMMTFAIITSLNVALNIFLIPVYGFTGAAVALVVSYLVGWSFSVYKVKKDISWPLTKEILKPASVAIILSLPLVLLEEFVTMNIFTLAASSLAYAGAYLYLLVWLELLEEEEREIVHFLLKKVKDKWRKTFR
ncbi:MAG: flippase [Candidatus Aenigmatarchaeota archaeon]